MYSIIIRFPNLYYKYEYHNPSYPSYCTATTATTSSSTTTTYTVVMMMMMVMIVLLLRDPLLAVPTILTGTP